MSLLSIISDPAKGCAVRCGLTPPTSLFGSSDPNAPLLIALAQEEGEELCAPARLASAHITGRIGWRYGRTALHLPADFDRFLRQRSGIVNQQQLNDRGARRNSLARHCARRCRFCSEWRPARAWRCEQHVLISSPAPVAGRRLRTIYCSKNFVRSNIGVAKDGFTADTDTTVIPSG
jgi:hypothetical protein